MPSTASASSAASRRASSRVTGKARKPARKPAGKATAGRGLVVERRFTRPDTDVFDLFDWERRLSEIVDYKTGRVVHRMESVEVPASWDQVAVDTLASKYFRKAGVPQRTVSGELMTNPDGSVVLGPETSAKQWAWRLANGWTVWGERGGYFADAESAAAFRDEMMFMLLAQLASPNSPQHFNTGMFEAYGIVASPEGNWYWDAEAQELRQSEHRYERSAANACFILSIADELVGPGSIFDSYTREARLFKGGSGAGSNYSRLRSAGEKLSAGGTSSGTMGFIKASDRCAGVIKSGGATRRAAKMVILNDDHPEIFDFIRAKAEEERKVAALIAAGYEADFNGEAYATVAYQNFNSSVRLSAGFMAALDAGGDWSTTTRTTGEVVETFPARKLWDELALAAWQCADPGVQYDDIINDWNTAANDGRINATNPCFPADQRVVTDKGLVRIGDLVARAAAGETFGVYTNDVTRESAPENATVATVPLRYMVNGTKEILELRFTDGSRLRCTANHRVWTDRGWVEAAELTESDRVHKSAVYSPRTHASAALPVSTDVMSYRSTSGHPQTTGELRLPEKWSAELGHFLGWLVGDGALHMGRSPRVSLVYGNAADQRDVLPVHQAWIRDVLGVDPLVVDAPNGTRQLRVNRRAFARFLTALGVCAGKAGDKTVPAAVLEAPEAAMTAFLRGLFDADGTVVDQEAKGTRYVGLGSRSEELLLGVQELLASLGVHSRMYRQESSRQAGTFTYTTTAGAERSYTGAPVAFDLRITGRNIARFASLVGFSVTEKADRLAHVVAEHEFYAVDETVALVSRRSTGFETTYNLNEPRNHSYVVSGIVVANCSEYVFLDDTACNLASINLANPLLFDVDAQRFDAAAYEYVVRLWTLMLEITVAMSHYPSPEVARNSYRYRTLGLGFANLGTLLMLCGLAYDSDEGRAVMAGVTALMLARAYATSAEMAEAVGPCEAWADNVEPMSRVLRNHRRAAYGSLGHDPFEGLSVEPMVLDHAVLGRTPLAGLAAPVLAAMDEMLTGVDRAGYRNMQACVTAPTGTIGLQMGCQTTGVEPDFALVKMKVLAGGGSMLMVNSAVEPALRALGYTDAAVARILTHALGTRTLDGPTTVNRAGLVAKGLPEAAVERVQAALAGAWALQHAVAPHVVGADVMAELGVAPEVYGDPGFSLLAHLGFTDTEVAASSTVVCGHHTVEGAADLKDEHLAIFDTANYCGDGTRVIDWAGHVKALGAVHPFVSGSVSKTVNMPADVTVEDVKAAYRLAYDCGVKCLAIYRDGSKLSQPLNSRQVAADDAGDVVADGPAERDPVDALRELLTSAPVGVSPAAFYHGVVPPKFKLPRPAPGLTWSANVGGMDVFLRTGQYPDGTLGEIFIDLGKEGSTLKGVLTVFAIAVSHALQYGVPLEKLVDRFVFHNFDPAGVVTGDRNVKMASSIVDYVFRVLGYHYLGRDELAHVPSAVHPNPSVAAARAGVVVDEPSGRAAVSAVAATPTAVLVAATAPEPADVQEPVAVPAGDKRSYGGGAGDCGTCGGMLVWNGACKRCTRCGATTGCS